MVTEILVDGEIVTVPNTPEGIAELVEARIAAAARLFGGK